MAAGDEFDTTATMDPSTDEAGPPPANMPDFARYIPTGAIEAADNQEKADEWAKGANQSLADVWAQSAQQHANDMLTMQIHQSAQDPAITDFHIQGAQQPDLVSGPESLGSTDITPPQPTMQEHGQAFAQGMLDLLKNVLPTFGTPSAPGSNALQQAQDELQKAAISRGLPVAPQIGGNETPESLTAKQAESAQHFTGATLGGQLTSPDIMPPNPEHGEAPPASVLEGTGARLATGAEDLAGAAGKAAEPVAEAAAKAEPAAADPIQKIVENLGLDLSKPADAQRLQNAQALLADDTKVANLQKAVDKNIANGQAPDARMGTTQADAYALQQEIEKAAAAKPPEVPPAAAGAPPTPPPPGEIPPGAPGSPEDWESIGRGAEPPATPEGPTVTAENRPIESQPNPQALDAAPYTGAGESKLADKPVIKGINTIQGVLKQAILAGSVFHPLVESAQLGRTALAEGKPLTGAKSIATAARGFLDSGFAQKYAADNADAIRRAEAAGATMMRTGGDVSPDLQKVGNNLSRTLLSSAGSGVAGYASGKAQGESNEDALKRGALFAAGGAAAGRFAPILNDAMFKRMIPIAKTEAYKMLEPHYGAEAAATRVNDTFGGQNLAKLGRNPEVQTLLKTTFLAPDWLESWARNMGAAVTPGPQGDAARRFWAATGISSAIGLEGLNYALNGHLTTDNEPGRQMQLEVTPIVRAMGGDPNQRYYADVLNLGPLGTTLQAAARGAVKGDIAGSVGNSLLTGHLNVAPEIAGYAKDNHALTGGQIVQPGTPATQAAIPEIAAAASHVAPIGMSTFEKPDVPAPVAAGSALSGVRIQSGPAAKATATSTSPFAPKAGARTQPKNLSNLRSFLSGPAAKTTSPFAPKTGKNGLTNLRGLK